LGNSWYYPNDQKRHLPVRSVYGIFTYSPRAPAQDSNTRYSMNKLEQVLTEYHKYLTRRKLAKAEHVPYLVRWVREFLRFAKGKTGHMFDTVDSPR